MAPRYQPRSFPDLWGILGAVMGKERSTRRRNADTRRLELRRRWAKLPKFARDNAAARAAVAAVADDPDALQAELERIEAAAARYLSRNQSPT